VRHVGYLQELYIMYLTINLFLHVSAQLPP